MRDCTKIMMCYNFEYIKRRGTRKMKKFIEEFKTFALRGNVMDMAVGVIFLVCGARSYYQQKLIALSCEHIGYFLIPLCLYFLYLLTCRILFLDLLRIGQPYQ